MYNYVTNVSVTVSTIPMTFEVEPAETLLLHFHDCC